MKILYSLIVLMTLTTLALAQGTTQEVIAVNTQEYYTLQIDCYDSNIDFTDTNDIITVTFIAESGASLGETNRSGSSLQLEIVGLTTESTSPKCDSVGDAVYYSFAQNNAISAIKSVEVKTAGSDAFWMDEVRLFKNTLVETTTKVCSDNGIVCGNSTDDEITEVLLAHWGRDGGKGYCLSVDKSDGGGSWTNFVDQNVQCVEKFTFDVASGEALASVQPQNTLVSYTVSIKTGTDSGAGTDANIFLTINGSAATIGEFRLNPMISGDAFENGDTDTVTLSAQKDIGNPTSITLRSDGSFAGSSWQVNSVVVQKSGANAIRFNCKNTFLDEGTLTCTP